MTSIEYSSHSRNSLAPLLAERWRGFWFAAVSPTNLALVRILFFALIFMFYMNSGFERYIYPPEFYKPCWLFETFHLKVLPIPVIQKMQLVWKAALVCACVGLFTRVSTFTAFMLGLYLFGLRQNWGKTGHGDNLPLWFFLTFAVSRCGDWLSLDYLIKRYWLRRPPPHPSGEYNWPIKMTWVIMATVFFAAGWAKARHGDDWVMSDTMKNLLLSHHFMNQPSGLGLWIAKHDWLCKLLAFATVATELLFPLALVSRWLRWPFVFGALLMQVGIAVLMDVVFLTWMICYIVWIRWDRVAAAVVGATRWIAGGRKLRDSAFPVLLNNPQNNAGDEVLSKLRGGRTD
jgi:hypothetical protein